VKTFDAYEELWVHDFEFHARLGEVVIPLCLVAHELRSRRHLRLWCDELICPPYRTDKKVLFISYYAVAELSCHLALHWPMPVNVLDLCVEFKNLTNGRELSDGRSLLGAVSFFGLDAITAAEKTAMQQLAIRGAPFTLQERNDLIDYCETDVVALEKLLAKMAPRINLPQALHRGRFMRALAATEHNGIPIDVESLQAIRSNWTSIKLDLISTVGKDFDVYDGIKFKLDKFVALLKRMGVKRWPQTDGGKLSKADKIFRDMCKVYPQLEPLRGLNQTISKMRIEKLAVGSDGRNRAPLWGFGTKTSRNAPESNKYVFGPSAWIRFLIQPQPGYAVAYVDYSSQEYFIAAVLSGDELMIGNYLHGDPYILFGQACAMIPRGATKHSHPRMREVFKAASLGILYGMSAATLAIYTGQSLSVAERILDTHHQVHHRFWEWIDGVLERALLRGYVQTCYGWRFSAPWKPQKPSDADEKPRKGVPVRTIKNFPVQATAAEMFRLAACLISEREVKLCGLVHDAFLVEAPVSEIQRTVRITKSAMVAASREIFKGKYELRTDAKIYEDRFVDVRGTELWETVSSLARKPRDVAPVTTTPHQQLELSL
jgi:hypothetical protein